MSTYWIIASSLIAGVACFLLLAILDVLVTEDEDEIDPLTHIDPLPGPKRDSKGRFTK